MVVGGNPANTAGPRGDGSNSLAKESKVGVAVGLVTTLVVDGVVDGLLEAVQNVDTSGWTGWWTTLASAALGTITGLLAAYKKRNR